MTDIPIFVDAFKTLKEGFELLPAELLELMSYYYDIPLCKFSEDNEKRLTVGQITNLPETLDSISEEDTLLVEHFMLQYIITEAISRKLFSNDIVYDLYCKSMEWVDVYRGVRTYGLYTTAKAE